MGAPELTKEKMAQPLQFTEGPSWESFEQFRTVGAKHLPLQLEPGQIGRLNVKGQEFVIMRKPTFDRLYGFAQDAARLSQGIRLIRQAAQLAFRADDLRMAITHLRDLILFLPETTTGERSAPRPLTFAPEERADEEAAADDFTLDPAQVRQAMRAGAR